MKDVDGVDWNKKLFKTLEYRGETATDYRFLKQLQKFVVDLFGNVNVAMRLHGVAEKVKK